MFRDNYLDIGKIIKDSKILRLFNAVESHGGVLRFVGGCVRDALMDIGGFDLDLATDLSPDELVEACEENNLKTVPIGIKFGTVGVVIGDDMLEVTSLRRDVETDGRHAVVEFTSDWKEDASRRDLTINAVYADEKGNVFDYYNGIEDLEKGIVRFIGNPNHRIKEDYLRILRFFRFYSIFGKGEMDKKALAACIENKDGMKQLSNDRVAAEVTKILLTNNVVKTLRVMFENDILVNILPNSKHLEDLEFLNKLTEKIYLPNKALERLFVLYMPDVDLAENLAARMKMTRKQRELFVDLAEAKTTLEDFMNKESLLRLVYKHGKEFCEDKFLVELTLAKKELPDLRQRLKEIDEMVVPVFMLRGKDIINLGIEDHKKIGSVLGKLEEIWMASGFGLTREELLEEGKRIVKG